ncbi:DUF805 domain-containing protein [Curtobacterium sp. RHCKG23]|uniref:DUF805 domain-containing protein n=1 Tax=Curtobacterium citri TaxID=3055139 RepID=A0ABT7T2Q0_9MICO|nr:DUF805 domain-containing protein [Curtobacterium citri]MDM7883848.1 DUF805 domain-containing protein [Curtobacterium citri]
MTNGEQHDRNPYQQSQQSGQQQPSGQPYPQPYPQYQQQLPIPRDESGAPPLWAPWYGAGFLDAFTRFWKKYARFDGRASRSEFWWWFLANAIVVLVLLGAYIASIIVWAAGATTTDEYGTTTSTGGFPGVAFLFLGLLALWGLATFIPSLALGWRRVHDAGLAGPFWLISFVGAGIAGIVFGCLEPSPAGAQYDQPDAPRPPA